MVEVFKTNIQDTEIATKVIARLLECLPLHRVTFDLEDCDRILRIEGDFIDAEAVISIISSANINCEVLSG